MTDEDRCLREGSNGPDVAHRRVGWVNGLRAAANILRMDAPDDDEYACDKPPSWTRGLVGCWNNAGLGMRDFSLNDYLSKAKVLLKADYRWRRSSGAGVPTDAEVDDDFRFHLHPNCSRINMALSPGSMIMVP